MNNQNIIILTIIIAFFLLGLGFLGTYDYNEELLQDKQQKINYLINKAYSLPDSIYDKYYKNDNFFNYIINNEEK